MLWDQLAAQPQELARFLLPAPQVGIAVTEAGAPERGLIPAAVMVPVVRHPDGASVLLTRRTDHLRDHAGQISFPGGRREDSDASLLHTALRETQEEVGLPLTWPQILGYLPTYQTGTGYEVTPVVALLEPGFPVKRDDFEVAEVFEVPLAFLLNPAHHTLHEREMGGVLRRYHAIPFEEYFIWGATAGMIISLARRCGIVSGSRPMQAEI